MLNRGVGPDLAQAVKQEEQRPKTEELDYYPQPDDADMPQADEQLAEQDGDEEDNERRVSYDEDEDYGNVAADADAYGEAGGQEEAAEEAAEEQHESYPEERNDDDEEEEDIYGGVREQVGKPAHLSGQPHSIGLLNAAQGALSCPS